MAEEQVIQSLKRGLKNNPNIDKNKTDRINVGEGCVGIRIPVDDTCFLVTDGDGGVYWSHPAFAYKCVFARKDQEPLYASLEK